MFITIFQEQVYTDQNFPTASDLEDSPKNLGISRADLWAFAGLVALDRIQSQTESMCEYNAYNYTCNDWESPCYSPFPNKATKLFYWSRFFRATTSPSLFDLSARP